MDPASDHTPEAIAHAPGVDLHLTLEARPEGQQRDHRDRVGAGRLGRALEAWATGRPAEGPAL